MRNLAERQEVAGSSPTAFTRQVGKADITEVFDDDEIWLFPGRQRHAVSNT